MGWQTRLGDIEPVHEHPQPDNTCPNDGWAEVMLNSSFFTTTTSLVSEASHVVRKSAVRPPSHRNLSWRGH